MWQTPFNPLRAPWNSNESDINDSIDWAALAKNWIQQKEMMGDIEETVAEVHQNFQPESSSVESVDPSLTTVNISDMTNADATDYTNFENYYENYENNEESISENWQESDWAFDSYHDASWVDPNFDLNNFNSMNPNLNLPAWAVPPPPPPDNQEAQKKLPLLSDIQLSMFNMANQSLIQNSMPFNLNQQRPPNFMHRPLGPGFPNMWVPIGQRMPSPSVPKLMGDMRPRVRNRPPGNWAPPIYNNAVLTVDDNFLDANRRRQLPAWIRDGLEKMEREKQKQLEKERRKRLELEAKQQKLLQQQLIDPSISKFDETDNDEEAEEGEDVGEDKNLEVVSNNQKDVVAAEEAGDELEEQISEEEKQIRLIMKVKQWMTEILLDVTNSEMVTIVNLVHRRAKSRQAKAPARQLASSSALASLCTLGEDSDYEEAEPAAESEREMQSSEASESEDEAIFRERLKCKRLQFERRMNLLEQQNYQGEVLPELVDNTKGPMLQSLRDDNLNEGSSSGEISDDDEDDEINLRQKSDSKKHNFSINKVKRKSPSSDRELMEQRRRNSDHSKRKFEELDVKKRKDYEYSNGNRSNNKDTNRRESTDEKIREYGKHDGLTNNKKSPAEQHQRRSSNDHNSSKKKDRRSKSSERKSARRKSKKDQHSRERSDRHRDDHKHRHKHESSSDQSRDNRSHRHHQSKSHRLQHRSRSRS